MPIPRRWRERSPIRRRLQNCGRGCGVAWPRRRCVTGSTEPAKLSGFTGGSISFDHEGEVDQILDYLTGLGHKRICFLANEPEASENVRLRIKFYEEECKARGLEALVVRCGTQFWDSSNSKAYSAMPQVMELKPTAIFAFDDSGAWAALKWCLNHGIRVPHDVSILGFANDRPSAFTHPALSTIAHPIHELATSAVDLVTNAPVKPQVKMFEPKLMVRESTGPAPK